MCHGVRGANRALISTLESENQENSTLFLHSLSTLKLYPLLTLQEETGWRNGEICRTLAQGSQFLPVANHEKPGGSSHRLSNLLAIGSDICFQSYHQVMGAGPCFWGYRHQPLCPSLPKLPLLILFTRSMSDPIPSATTSCGCLPSRHCGMVSPV
jgi:hypothetical protein